ncbi:alkaline phosphatase, tissue-nonspecific isozyme-like [Tribolium madens]|uniref:alkaline phosphatase, tissue-nonspecific isozyme-like n=1 Tax=Tribolium madens TaxID=41895 RepID=UPI001CF72374|nr:alkaline phosphatase, tissue-nonspecific isozyme-like [Tribolium madens]
MWSTKICAVLIYLSSLFNSVLNLNEDRFYWLNEGKNDIYTALNLEKIEKPSKNVILFIGDGMGLTTTTASRIYSKSESGFLSFEKFPHIATIKTYNADKLVPDSSSTATALFSGVKTNLKTSGVDSSVKLDDCEASLKPEARIDGLMKWAQESGKSTGFVTTTRITHATPSALYAHTPNRNWECESTIPENSKRCKDIARQLIEDEPGKNINVVMGGGRQCLQSGVEDRPGDPVDRWACYSTDGRDLIRDWELDKKRRNKSYATLTNNEELERVDTSKEFVLGVFANGHMSMDYARDKSPTGMPSLTNMTKKAIEILNRNSKGYILVIEGGLIDFAHHRGNARKALDETVSLSDAVQLAVEKTNPQDTLIIVTSDHSHSLVFTGYSSRNTSVLDIAQKSKMDQIPYTSLLYGTGGPNNYQFLVINNTVSRRDPSLNNTTDFEYSQQAVVLTDEVTHGGSDVLVYAKGPMSHLFHNVHEQTYVAYVISYAAKIGPFKSEASSLNYSNLFLSISVLLVLKNNFQCSLR